MSNQLENIVRASSPESWLGLLPSHQRHDFLALMEKKTIAEVAELWIVSTTTDHTNPFGAARNEPDSGRVWQALRVELCRFLRGHNSYSGIHAKISKSGAAAEIFIISLIAGQIAKQIDVNSALISPIVTIVLYTLSSVGTNTVCRLFCCDDVSETKPEEAAKPSETPTSRDDAPPVPQNGGKNA